MCDFTTWISPHRCLNTFEALLEHHLYYCCVKIIPLSLIIPLVIALLLCYACLKKNNRISYSWFPLFYYSAIFRGKWPQVTIRLLPIRSRRIYHFFHHRYNTFFLGSVHDHLIPITLLLFCLICLFNAFAGLQCLASVFCYTKNSFADLFCSFFPLNKMFTNNN